MKCALPLLVALLAAWSLACSGSHPHVGTWRGSCESGSDIFVDFEFDLVDNEGSMTDGQGEWRALDGLGTVDGSGWSSPIDVNWFHCDDSAGCVDYDGVERDTDYVLWIAHYVPETSWAAWQEGEADGKGKVLTGTCTINDGFAYIGPGIMERTGQ